MSFGEIMKYVFTKIVLRIVGLVVITLAISYGISQWTQLKIEAVTLGASIFLLAVAAYTVMGGQDARVDPQYNMMKVYTGLFNRDVNRLDDDNLMGSYKFCTIVGISGFIVLLLSGTLLRYNPKSLTDEERLEDFEYMHTVILENHPYLKSDESLVWLEEKDSFIDGIEKVNQDSASTRLKNSMFAVEVNNIIRSINNVHTNVINRESFIKLYSFYNNPINEERLSLWTDILEQEDSLYWYDLSQNELENNQGNDSVPLSVPLFRTSKIIADEVAYLGINEMKANRIDSDGVAIRRFFEEIKDYDKLIIDIRGNATGVDEYWMNNIVAPLINEEYSVDNLFFVRGNYSKKFYDSVGLDLYPVSELDEDMHGNFDDEILTDFDYFGIHNISIEPMNPVGFEGQVYLLIDEEVSGYTENFAIFSKKTGFATLVGETTGGNRLIVEPLLIKLPNSGIVIRYTGDLSFNAHGEISAQMGTTPHSEVNAKAHVPSYNRDEAIQYILNNE